MKTEIFSANSDELNNAMDFLDAVLEDMGAGMPFRLKVSVVLEELFVNVSSYAYERRDGAGRNGSASDPLYGKVMIAADTDPEKKIFTLGITDAGIPFDPLAKEDPDITLSAEERDIGGLGIFMVKKTMDTVEYRRENGRNILMMTKKY